MSAFINVSISSAHGPGFSIIVLFTLLFKLTTPAKCLPCVVARAIGQAAESNFIDVGVDDVTGAQVLKSLRKGTVATHYSYNHPILVVDYNIVYNYLTEMFSYLMASSFQETWYIPLCHLCWSHHKSAFCKR